MVRRMPVSLLVALVVGTLSLGVGYMLGVRTSETAEIPMSSADVATGTAVPGRGTIATDTPVAGVPAPGAVLLAPAGEQLTQLRVPPSDAIVALEQGSYGASTFEVTFEVYGESPAGSIGGQGRSVVIYVVSAKEDDETTSRFDPTGRNLVVELSRESSDVVTTGGRYTGTLSLSERESALAFVLDSARRR